MRAYQSKSYQQNEWTTSGMELYDFHARMYDPVIGRWHAPDPMNQFDSPYTAMADNPVVSIDPDGMWVPTGGILNSIGFMGRLTIVRKMTETTARDLTFEEVLGLKDNGVSSALQLAGAALAFNEGSQILSDGQKGLGKKGLQNQLHITYSRVSRTQIGGSADVQLNPDRAYGNPSSLNYDLENYLSTLDLGMMFQRFRLDEPSSYGEISYEFNDQNPKAEYRIGFFRNHTKGGFWMPDGNYSHFNFGNSQVGLGAGMEYFIFRNELIDWTANGFVGGGPQITNWSEGPDKTFDGWGAVGYFGLGIYGMLNGRTTLSANGSLLFHYAHMDAFAENNASTGQLVDYKKQYFVTFAPSFSLKVSFRFQR